MLPNTTATRTYADALVRADEQWEETIRQARKTYKSAVKDAEKAYKEALKATLAPETPPALL
jgi:ABC-type Zn uptake system ZnuABC Zn-binding protein ZnuA